MAVTPGTLPGIDFRAPPPSPVAPGRRSSFANDEVLTEYLHQSLKVPDLVLPDRVFPRQKSLQNPPEIDIQKLESLERNSAVEISDRIAQIGCVEVINHGISRDLIELVLDLGNGIFSIAPEKKKAVVRSPERRYGFEEIHVEDEIRGDHSEEFLWCADEAMRGEMEGIWPIRYSNFSQEMEKLSIQTEEICRKIVVFLHQYSRKELCPDFHDKEEEEEEEEEEEGSINVCYIQKFRSRKATESENELRYDVIRMLIRGSEFQHAVCLHICSGITDFHVYSKKGWISFSPQKQSLILTVGDKLQAWSNGQYKHVIGRPMLKGEDEKYISMAFLYSPPNITDEQAVTISVPNQIIIALLIIFIYQFLLYIYNILF